ncbi:MAG: DUF116 domain-containing protein [Methanomicrobiales archaeon]|nr:DUF116 domain-containing protein [Methanomicrobiales archaeon]
MFFDHTPLNQLTTLIGEVTLIFVLGSVLLSLLLLTIVVYSIRSGKLFFPKLVTSGFSVLEGMIKAICRFFGLEEKELQLFLVQVHNSMNKKTFEEIPVEKRAIFLPQCLRSTKCPARLTPEGIKCIGCGQCGIGRMKGSLEGMGYHIFVVPGSSFIQRMVRNYRPEGIIGVGCLIEVKEGLELCDRIGICGMGVVTLRDGCVETAVEWQDLFDVASIGLENDVKASCAHDLHVSSD